MAGTPSSYTPMNRHYAAGLKAVAEQVAAQWPQAWQKARAPHDDGEYCKRVAYACQQVGIPAFLNGKRGNVNDLSKDAFAFENSTGARDMSGRFSGIEIIDWIGQHEAPGAYLTWIDQTVQPGPPLWMPDGYSIVPKIVDSGGGGGPVPVDPVKPPVEPGNLPFPDLVEQRRELEHLHAFYKAHEGLQREDGLWIHGAPDFEGISAWFINVYLKYRIAGRSQAEARAAYIGAIKASHEWKVKHPNG